MRKEDMTKGAVVLEAITILLGIAYMGMQVYYGISYGVPASKFIWNLLAMLLLYALLTISQIYPEYVNKITRESFTPKIRKLTLWMLRILKFVLVAGLLIPCIFDCLGKSISGVFTIVVIFLLLAVAIGFEVRILFLVKEGNR